MTPPYSTTTIIFILILAGLIIVPLAMFFSFTISASTNSLNNVTTLIAKDDNQSINVLSEGNISIYYINGSYNQPQYLAGSFFVYIACIFRNPITLGVLIGISIVLSALFLNKKNP